MYYYTTFSYKSQEVFGKEGKFTVQIPSYSADSCAFTVQISNMQLHYANI